MSELKPCPFCGEENTDTGFILHKDECYLMLRYMGGHSKQEMINAWNTRPIEDALRNDILLLRSQRAGLEQTINEQAIEIQQANAEIDRLKSEMLFVPVFPQWIPVSKPPKKNGYFWCSIVDDAGCKWADKRLFSVENGWFTIGEQVTHWMPLPAEPPSEEEC